VGLILSLIGIVATVWLGFTGRLGLYIHPRYTVFTLIMALLAGVIAVIAFTVVPGKDDEHGHDDAPPPTRRGRVLRRGKTAGLVAIVVVAMFALLVLPPSTLSAATAQERTVNAAAPAPNSSSIDSILTGADTSTFTVKDWSLYLRMGASDDFLASHPAEVVGFVSADPDDPQNVFYVTRFTITCCAVDATPIGLAVYLPGWSDRYHEGDWVSVNGSIVANPSSSSAEPFAIAPSQVSPVAEPPEPYVY